MAAYRPRRQLQSRSDPTSTRSPIADRRATYDRAVRPRPQRLERLPEQYFTNPLRRVAEAAAAGGEPVVDFGRGNPEVGPPPHVIERLAAAARDGSAHGYPPFRGLPELRRAIADRYAALYDVELDPDREVSIVPGTKTAIVELALVLVERGRTILLPDPGYPDYPSGVAMAAARTGSLPLDADAGWAPDFGAVEDDDVAAVYLNYPSNPCAAVAPSGAFAAAVRFAEESGATIVHDFAYGDVVFDGRRPESFLATLAARVATYERRRDQVLEALAQAAIAPPECEGSFYVWIELSEGMTPERLLVEHRVAVAPGEGFGSRGTGWARLSLAIT